MDRNALEERLRTTKAHIVLGNEHIACQRELVSVLEQAGKDASAANQLLKLFHKLQEMHIAEVWKLSVQLVSIAASNTE
jgi:hypothetical protein